MERREREGGRKQKTKECNEKCERERDVRQRKGRKGKQEKY